MSDRRYNWKRFWCPPDGTLPLTDDGYLLDPESDWAPLAGHQVKPFDAIGDAPCLGLLGEPGMGKSTEMRVRFEALVSRPAQTGDVALWFDLANYTTDAWLCKDIFEDRALRAWAAGTHRLHLFLDSLDEGRLSVTSIATLLPTQFEKLRPHLNRLSLCVACRTLEWPSVFESKLKELWGEDYVRAYELCPLRERDVAEAARANGLEVATFLEGIREREAGPLAAKPITLEFLLGIHRRGAGLPHTRRELYEEGCRILCEEHNPSRRDSGRSGELSAEQRFALASRLAALTVLSNRAAIWTGPDDGSVRDSDLRISETCGGTEELAGQVAEVTTHSVRETLNTGLFSSRGPHRMGWAHQSYGEFLAAWYLVHRGMPKHQIASLIAHPLAPEGKLVPQLYETAAWLASLSPAVSEYVARVDPQVLLRGDIGGMPRECKAQLTGAILELFENEKLMDTDRRLRQGYAKLAHPGLADQLRPYVTDRQKGWLVRRVAIDIVEECSLRGLQDDLLRVALDSEDHYRTRVHAAYALERIADDEIKRSMRPMAYGECGEDPDDELKGCALRALWPHHMSAQQLFRLIASPLQSHLVGAYSVFLHYELAAGLSPDDLPAALNWIAAQVRRGMSHLLEGLADRIMVRAVENLDAPGVLEAAAEAAIPFLRELRHSMRGPSDDSFEKRLREDEATRRRMVGAMLPLIGDEEEELFPLLYHPQVITRDDLPWLVELLEQTQADRVQRTISRLVDTLYIYADATHTELLFRAARRSPVLWERVRHYFEPVSLDSPEFKRRYESHLKIQKLERASRERLPERPDPKELIARFVGELDAGDDNGWWHLNWAMAISREGYLNELESDLTALPGWQQVVELLGEQRLVECAGSYLLRREPDTPTWLGSDTMDPSAMAGYRALVLLRRLAPDRLRALPLDAWRKWAPIAVAYPTAGEETIHQEVVALAYRAAPSEAIATLHALIDKDSRQHDHIFVIRKMERSWDERLGQAVLEKAREPHLKPTCMRDLLAELVKRNAPGARAFAESLLSLPIPAEEDARSRAVAAGGALMIHADDGGWPIVWPAMQADVEFGRAVASSVATDSDSRASRSTHRLSEDQLADLYIWVSRQYPRAEDPEWSGRGAHWVGPREEIARWRDSLLTGLKGRGTLSSSAEVGRIARSLPEADFLKWHVLEAQDTTYRNEWKAPSPAYVLQLVHGSEVRLVRNGDELMAVLEESLERLQAKLQGELSAARDLWNEEPEFRPKDEEALSDYIARRLRDDLVERGIVANREVKITVGRTDIHVDALAVHGGDGYGTASAIVEIKGCWHREVGTAMKTQLVDQYLSGSACSYGLYVVGWFASSRWDPEKDRRKRDVRHASIEEMREDLERQATDLSVGGVSIRAIVLDASLR